MILEPNTEEWARARILPRWEEESEENYTQRIERIARIFAENRDKP